jgi:putative ABC transport system ATP-binding protein
MAAWRRIWDAALADYADQAARARLHSRGDATPFDRGAYLPAMTQREYYPRSSSAPETDGNFTDCGDGRSILAIAIEDQIAFAGERQFRRRYQRRKVTVILQDPATIRRLCRPQSRRIATLLCRRHSQRDRVSNAEAPMKIALRSGTTLGAQTRMLRANSRNIGSIPTDTEECMRAMSIGDAVSALWTRLPFYTLFRRLLPKGATDGLQPTIYGFILRYSWREQIYVVVMTLLSFPFLYYSLELPKVIINRAISGKHFPQSFFGLDLRQIPFLLALCGIFLALVLINGWFKLHVNVKKGQLGERMLRRLRYELYERLLRFPLHHFDRTATGQIVAMVTAELEPVGGFVGEAFAVPISQAGTLLTILFFMFVQNPVLGAAALAFYPLQGYLIPKMQRIIRALGRTRIRKIRGLSDRIGETIAARIEIRTNHAAPYQLAEIAHRLGEIYDIRLEIYNRKFFVKFLNNLIGNLTPFFFFAVGGYFVITGELSFGALVAVLAAYKDMSSPWNELLNYYQNQQDVAIKYEQVVEQFHVADMVDKRLLLEEPDRIEPFAGEVVAANVDVVDSDGIHLLEAVNFAFPLGIDVGIVGHSNSGRNMLPQLIARLVSPTSGRLSIDGADIAAMPFAVSGRRIGYVGPITYLFSASVRDNLLIGLRHRPRQMPDYDTAAKVERERAIEEARLSGNSADDIAADWIDYEQAGVAEASELQVRILDVLRLVDLDEDVYFWGLRGRLDPDQQPKIAAQIVEARHLLANRLAESGAADLVERFSPDRYNANSTVGANLLFGTSIGPALEGDGLARNHYALSVLGALGLPRDLINIGGQLARTSVELFSGMRPEHQFFEEFSVVGAEDLPEFQRILARIDKLGIENLLPQERVRLLGLALRLIAARDPLGLVDQTMQKRILQARRDFAAGLPDELRGSVEFFDPERYNAAASILENVLFGTIVRGEAGTRERIFAAMSEVLDELRLREAVVAVGLDYPVGTGGSRLSEIQRQKIAIAVAVLKRPDFIAFNDATAVLDGATEAAIVERLKHELDGRSLVCSLHRPRLASAFDRILVMEQGRLVEQGPYDELQKPGHPLAPLMAAE